MARTEQQSNEKYGGRWFWRRYASPAAFFPLAGRIEVLCWVLAVLLAGAGLYLGFFVAPTDAQQGEVYRVISSTYPRLDGDGDLPGHGVPGRCFGWYWARACRS